MFSAQIHTLSTLAWSQVYLYVSSTWRERTSPICEWFRLSPKTFPKWTPHENENSQSQNPLIRIHPRLRPQRDANYGLRITMDILYCTYMLYYITKVVSAGKQGFCWWAAQPAALPLVFVLCTAEISERKANTGTISAKIRHSVLLPE